MESKNRTIFLVHGTFAPDADWTKSGSLVSQLLSKRGVDDGYDIAVKKFIWTGDNSHAARLTAAESLADALRKETKSNPDVHLICHSHGGTVARKAIDLLEIDECPKSVVTFGTPFINFEKKNTFVPFLLSKIIALFLLIMTPLAFYLFANVTPIFNFDDFAIFGLSQELLIIMIPIITFYPLFIKFPNIFRKLLDDSASQLDNKYQSRDRNFVPFCCFVTLFDEAGMLLKFWSFITNLFIVIQVSIIVSIIYFALVTFSIVIFPFMGGDFFRDAYITLFPDPQYPFDRGGTDTIIELWAGFMLFINSSLLVALMLLFVVISPVSLVVPWLLRRQSFAFGEEGVLGNIAMNIYVSAVPNPNSNLITKYFPWKNLSGALRHSAFYEDQDTLEEAYLYIKNNSDTSGSDTAKIHSRRTYIYIVSMMFGLIPLYLYYLLYDKWIESIASALLAVISFGF